MMFERSPKTRVGHLALAAAFVLQGCASGASKPKVTVAPPPPPPPTASAPEQVITMKPIPNPEPGRPARTTHTTSHRAAAKAAEGAGVAVKAPPRPQPVADHARAARLRAQGLEELDRGRINRAVGLLQAAEQLDPANPLIHHDLDRALRISKAVHSRS